ncbi:MAG: hypothetical protein L6408_02330 [Nanoarchaeota archaeon]|nr:hypothetical protein [Nanoarchaeota archaeon]
MKMPNTFRTNKELTEAQLEKIIKETLVDKVLVKSVAKEVAEYLQDKDMSKDINIEFEKFVNVRTLSTIKLESGENENDSYVERYFQLGSEAQKTLLIMEKEKIIASLLDFDETMAETDVYHEGLNKVQIISENGIYVFNFLDYRMTREEEETDETRIIEVEVKKPNKVFKAIFFPNKEFKEQKEVPLKNVYEIRRIYGSLEYAKFSKKAHDTVVNALKDNGYDLKIKIQT